MDWVRFKNRICMSILENGIGESDREMGFRLINLEIDMKDNIRMENLTDLGFKNSLTGINILVSG